MLVAALDRWRKEEEQRVKADDHRAGVIAAAVYTAGGVRRGAKKTWEPKDFFRSLVPERVQEEQEQAAQIMGAMQAWRGMFGKPKGAHAS